MLLENSAETARTRHFAAVDWRKTDWLRYFLFATAIGDNLSSNPYKHCVCEGSCSGFRPHLDHLKERKKGVVAVILEVSMIRVLFVCWGSIRRNLEKPRDFGTLRGVQKRI